MDIVSRLIFLKGSPVKYDIARNQNVSPFNDVSYCDYICKAGFQQGSIVMRDKLTLSHVTRLQLDQAICLYSTSSRNNFKSFSVELLLYLLYPSIFALEYDFASL